MASAERADPQLVDGFGNKKIDNTPVLKTGSNDVGCVEAKLIAS